MTTQPTDAASHDEDEDEDGYRGPASLRLEGRHVGLFPWRGRLCPRLSGLEGVVRAV